MRRRASFPLCPSSEENRGGGVGASNTSCMERYNINMCHFQTNFMHFSLKKGRQINTCDINLEFQGHSIKSEETVKVLGVTLDYKLNFDPHLSNPCKKAAAQLNILKRLSFYIGFAENKVLVHSFVYSNFNY